MLTAPLKLRTHREWLNTRRIGGSDVAAILGLSPYRGPWDVRERLVDGRIEDRTDDDRERGHDLEPQILRRYVAETGTALYRPGRFAIFRREEWATASVDALSKDNTLVVEAKSDRHRHHWGESQVIERWEPRAERIVRADYYLQAQHYLWVLDLQVADLAVLLPGDDPFIPELRIYRLLRDEELVASLVERLSTWWRLHVVERRPLEVDGSAAAGRYLARWSRDGARAATGPEVALAAGYETARRTAVEAEAAKRRLGQLLAVVAGPAKRLDLPRGHVTIVTTAGRTTLDERALLADHPELAPVLNEYRRVGDPIVHARIYGLEAA